MLASAVDTLGKPLFAITFSLTDSSPTGSSQPPLTDSAAPMHNYFNYFTEIEEHFSRRRGTLLLLSTLDWALIETWREAGVPLAAALRGIDESFDKYEARKTKGRVRKVNGLAWCAQAVITAMEDMQEAAVGATPVKEAPASGLEQERIAAHLSVCADAYAVAAADHAQLADISTRLAKLAGEVRAQAPVPEELERTLTVLEEKLFAALHFLAPEEELVALREQAARELAPYRSRMQAVQIRQIERQFLHKRLLERYNLPRLSLFYMQQT